ncbi:zinc finger BED domain-containing protein 4-like [Tachysurus vachellii]|uniref:zinc finger BED domain-containing protein 4-like n=1 Tax=Tachysurus vachellii TaxID=175792 RepID=UPI00296ADFDD|nr:zinc finger BED domain-containing protein 4-like [Tachysurus vachellii]
MYVLGVARYMKKHPNCSVRLSRFGSFVRRTVRRMHNVALCSVSPQTVSREHTYSAAEIARGGDNEGCPELADAPASFKSGVWEHFGFHVTYDDNGNKTVDRCIRTATVCKHCAKCIQYANGNTSNMTLHLRRHHANVLISTNRREPVRKQPLLSAAFKQPLSDKSDRAIDMQPCSVIESKGFHQLMNVLELRFNIPSRRHFGTTESFLTVTAHYITSEWEMRSCVLQTHPIYESHTSEHLSEMLTDAVAEWKLERVNSIIPVTTDNAKNIVNATDLAAGLGPQIGCFAHTVNLAVKSAISLNQVSRLLEKVRKVVSFFHRSTTAAHALKTKQDMLELPVHKLIHDVTTHSNSRYDMLQCYVEQQAAIYSAIMDKDMKKKVNDIALLTESETKLAEGLINILKPLKNVITLMSTKTSPSVSTIIPQQKMIQKSMTSSAEDSTTIKEAKAAITKDLKGRLS